MLDVPDDVRQEVVAVLPAVRIELPAELDDRGRRALRLRDHVADLLVLCFVVHWPEARLRVQPMPYRGVCEPITRASANVS